MKPELKEALQGNLKRWSMSVLVVLAFLYFNKTSAPVFPVAIGILGTLIMIIAWCFYSTRDKAPVTK